MPDDRYRHPSVGTLALMVEGERELRINATDSGHQVVVTLSEHYRPTLVPGGSKYSGPGRTERIILDKPYTTAKLLEAIATLKERASNP